MTETAQPVEEEKTSKTQEPAPASPAPPKRSLRKWWNSATTKKRRTAIVTSIGVVSGIVGILAWAQTEFGGSSSSAIISPFAPSNCPKLDAEPTSGTGTMFVVALEEANSAKNCWSTILAPVSPGATVKYLLEYKNMSKTVQKNVIAEINLAPRMLLLPNSTFLANPTDPKGILYDSDNIASGGINIGDYGPGQNAYVEIKVAAPDEGDLRCGLNDLRSVGVFEADHVGYYHNTVELEMSRAC